MPGRSLKEDGPKERFNEHEKDGETGFYYAGAPFMDPEIGRFVAVDPHAHSYPGFSPCIYALNKPLVAIGGKCSRWEEDASVWWNPLTWGNTKTVSGYKLSTADSDFDWSQDKYTSALYDVINSSEIVFDLSIVPENFEMPGTRWTAYDIQGANFASAGGGRVIVARNNRLGEPIGVVIMHELVGHGHPVGGNRALNVNDYYQANLGYWLREPRGASPLHGGYVQRIGWQRTGLFGR